MNECIGMRRDHRGTRRIAARQRAAFRRHREHQRGGANQDVMEVDVIHRRRDAFRDDLVVQAFRRRVVRLHVAVDDPREAPIVVLPLLHHDPVEFRPPGAVFDEATDDVGELFDRVEPVRGALCNRQILGLVGEQRLDRRLPQAFLRAEVVGDQPAVHAGFGLDLAGTDRVVTALGEQRDRGLQQFVAGHLRPFLDQFALRNSHRRIE